MSTTTVTLTKAEALAAIKDSTLIRLGWISQEHRDDTVEDCRVCAVGALLRRAARVHGLRLTVNDINDSGRLLLEAACLPPSGTGLDELVVEKLIEEGRWLNALSCVFEAGGEEEALRFVSERFPEVVDIELCQYELP